MKSRIYNLVVGVAFIACANACAQSPSETLAHQAKQSAEAILKKDYESAVRFMYPPIVERMGGSEKAVAFVKTSMADMEAKGWAIENITVGPPSAIVAEEREDVAIVPTEMVMNFEGKRATSSSYLVAVTQNHGKNWYFLDGAQLPKEKLARLYPKLVAQVKVPERKNSLVDEINQTLQRIEKKEGKPIQKVLDDRQVESPPHSPRRAQ